jgi:alpha-ribazole phosphatase
MITTIDLMRHGEPVGGRKYRGQTDDPLSDKGWAQMWAAVGDFSGWQHIVTSPLSRCASFAEALGAKLHIPVTADDRLKEIAFGDWEGKLPSEICADDSQRIFKFRCDPIGHAPPGTESLIEFHARVGAAWCDMLREHQGSHILIVGHAGVIRMALCHALGLPPENAYRINVGNAALTRIRVEQEDGQSLAVLMFHEAQP